MNHKTLKLTRQGSTDDGSTGKVDQEQNKAGKRHTPSVAFSEEEMAKLVQAAANAGYAKGKITGVTRYIRDVVLGYNPPSVLDHKLLVELFKMRAELSSVRADLGKAAGLFKMAHFDGRKDSELLQYADQMKDFATKASRFNEGFAELIREITEGKWNA